MVSSSLAWVARPVSCRGLPGQSVLGLGCVRCRGQPDQEVLGLIRSCAHLSEVGLISRPLVWTVHPVLAWLLGGSVGKPGARGNVQTRLTRFIMPTRCAGKAHDAVKTTPHVEQFWFKLRCSSFLVRLVGVCFALVV
jgi:hypothetical protein